MSNQSSVAQLGTKPVGALLLQYSIPAIIGMTITSLYNIIDSIYIGHGVGAMAISGLAVTFPLMNLIMAICLLVAVGGSTVASIELGRKNQLGASNVLGNLTVLSVIFGFVFGALCLIILDPLLILFGASSETLPYARDFMQILLFSLPIGFAMLGLNSIMRSTGYPKKAMLTALLSVAVNVVLAPIFIFVLDWGIRGAAFATVIAQAISLVWIVLHFFRQDTPVRFTAGIFKLRRHVIMPMLSIGLSPFLMNVCACIVVIFLNNALYQQGGDLAIGAYGIINRVIMLFLMVVMGLTQGMQPIIGYNFGARQPARVRETLKYGIFAGSAVTLLGFLIFQFLPGPLSRMFTDNTELIDLAVGGLRLCSALFFLAGAQIVIAAFFQSIGMVSVAIFLSLARQLLFIIPGLLIFPIYFDLSGVWLSLPVADALAFLASALILWRSWHYKVNACGGFGDDADCTPPEDFE